MSTILQPLSRKTRLICALILGPDHKSIEQVARRYGVSQSAVYKRLSRARQELAHHGLDLPKIPRQVRKVRVRTASQMRRKSTTGVATVDELG
jgi:transposase-like protein